MRTLDIGFASHIETGATTLATCWRIIRVDGPVLGFSDHDVELEFDGTSFVPAHGLDSGETASKLGAQVDASEIVGFVHSSAIDENDILLGRYDGATVETWKVNWRDVSQRHLMRRDTVGEIVRTDGVFRLELRSAQHALNIAKGKIYQGLCGTNLGDTPCGINVDLPAFRADKTIIAIDSRQTIRTSLLAGFAQDWFSFGHAVWNSGRREGKIDRIVLQAQENGESVLTLADPIWDWVEPGDAVSLFAGCDRQFSTCRSKFANNINFRGFPHIPGNDFVLHYPKAGGSFGGKPLFR